MKMLFYSICFLNFGDKGFAYKYRCVCCSFNCFLPYVFHLISLARFLFSSVQFFFFGLNFHCYYVPFSLSDFAQMEDALAIVSNLGSVYLLCIEFGSVYLLCIEFLGIMVNKKFYWKGIKEVMDTFLEFNFTGWCVDNNFLPKERSFDGACGCSPLMLHF